MGTRTDSDPSKARGSVRAGGIFGERMALLAAGGLGRDGGCDGGLVLEPTPGYSRAMLT
jgi:hypothetical protein